MSYSANNKTAEETTRALTETDYHGLLVASRRRYVIDILLDNPRPIELTELATAVAKREDGDKPVSQVEAQLHHRHLPKMDEMGVIDYEPTEGRVEPQQVLINSVLAARRST